MQTLRRIILVAAALAFFSGAVGCSYMPHFLQPHQLQKYNRGVNGTPASDYD